VTRNFFDGIRYLKNDKTLMLLILLIFVPSLFVHSVQFQFASIAGIVFADGPWTLEWRLGLLGAAMGAGALLATLFVASLGRFGSRGKLNMTAVILVTVFLVFFGLSSNIYLSLALIGLVGFFNTMFRLANNALVQSRTPDELRGRITSIYVLDHGFQPAGSPALGLLAQESVLGLQRAIVLAALLALLITGFIGVKYRQLWQLK
jgi:sugar phosphate permease